MEQGQIKLDPDNHRVEVFFDGYLSEGDAANFQENLRSSVLRVRSPDGWFDILADCTNLNVMDQAVADSSARTLAWCQENGMRRGANIVGSTLLKLQIQRITPLNDIRNFETRAEAVAWLEND